MGWFFNKRFKGGPFRTTISKNGLGQSFGFFGFRLGVSADGKRFWSFGIKGTGLYYIKYF
jgi:hypothetical protein